MKKFMILLIILFSVSFLFSHSLKNEEPTGKTLDQSEVNDMANFRLRISNFGVLGKANNSTNYPSLEYPKGSDINYFYVATIWIGAKKIRKDENGNSLYWLPNANDANDVVTEFDSLWTPDLELVVDTLTSVGYDGDLDLYELLPAYNPLEFSALGFQYNEYNLLDNVIRKIGNKYNFDDDNDGLVDEDNLGNPFDYNDPTNIFCFTNPTDEDGDGLVDEDTSYPGFETSLSYFYDYSPFGTTGQRDYGDHYSANEHVPLRIAIKQEIYDWPVQNYANFAIIKNTIYNTSEQDTLFDVVYSYFVDPDIGPEGWGNVIAGDDVSSYVGEGYDFAYAYDADHDNGLTPGYIGIKTFTFNNENFDCWTWQLGDGPADFYVQTPGYRNQKYALMQGINPNYSRYTSLKQYPDIQTDYPLDTRFLYTVYGDQNGFDNPTINTINLLPGDSLVYYTAILLGNSVDELKNEVMLAEEFINSNFDYSVFEGLPSIPYLKSLENNGDGNSIKINWETLTVPDEFRIYHKEADAPASTWEYIVVDANLHQYIENDLDENIAYKFKVASLFGDVYLESQTLITTPYCSSDSDETLPPITKVYGNYPNPFNPSTTIEFDVSKNETASLKIFNIKGQLVKTYKNLDSGKHRIVWYGKDEKGKTVASGVYFYELKTKSKTIINKMLMIK